MSASYGLAIFASLLVLASACTEQNAEDRIAERQESPRGDANARPSSPESPPYSPPTPAPPVAAPIPEAAPPD